MKITVAGYGFVGKAYSILLESVHDVIVYDPPKNMTDFGSPEAVLICVATPQGDDGTCYMGHVFEVMDLINDGVPVLIKSTISLEGWKELLKRYPKHKISFSPEFLRQKSAVLDVLTSNDMLIGGESQGFWQSIFVSAKESLSVIHFTPEELILAKYFRNSFLATKVSFFNQINDLCEKADLDYENVRQAIAFDERIGESHTYVSEEKGFGGHCFPKDTSAILETAKNLGYSLSVLQEAVEYNKRIRRE